jgi:pyridoxal phosphate enzyme (YggS family)
MSTIASNIAQVLNRIAISAQQAQRNSADIHLLAVSKTVAEQGIREAFQAGQHAFGENYLQEALEKITQLHDLAIEWHFIGPLQSNKTRPVAENFAWVHSVDRLKIAERLSAQRPNDLPPLQLCIQVNIDDEDSKSGCHPNELQTLIRAILMLPNIQLRGLMCIPKPHHSQAFAELAELQQQLLATIPDLNPQTFDTLSMGMSDDLDAAILAGSTWVRVGSAIFGQRPKPQQSL